MGISERSQENEWKICSPVFLIFFSFSQISNRDSSRPFSSRSVYFYLPIYCCAMRFGDETRHFSEATNFNFSFILFVADRDQKIGRWFYHGAILFMVA